MTITEKDIKKGDNLECPLVSIIICAFSSKRFDMTVDCINSIFNNTYKNYEIILVIDGNERLKQKIEDRFKDVDEIIVIGNKKDSGPSIARNHGIEIANGNIIAFIDDDAVAPNDWLERIAKNFSDNQDIIVIGGRLLPIYNNNNNKYKLPEELLWIVGCTYNGHPENKQFMRNVISANMAVKKDIFKEINFETMHNKKNRFFTPIKQLEDTLFCVRINNRVHNAVLYDPDIIVHHNVPIERLRIEYILKRTFSEGMLKAKLGHIDDKNAVLSYEQSYLNILLISIIKNSYRLRIRNSLLLSIVIISVAMGYISETILFLSQKRRYLSELNMTGQKGNV